MVYLGPKEKDVVVDRFSNGDNDHFIAYEKSSRDTDGDGVHIWVSIYVLEDIKWLVSVSNLKIETKARITGPGGSYQLAKVKNNELKIEGVDESPIDVDDIDSKNSLSVIDTDTTGSTSTLVELDPQKDPQKDGKTSEEPSPGTVYHYVDSGSAGRYHRDKSCQGLKDRSGEVMTVFSNNGLPEEVSDLIACRLCS